MNPAADLLINIREGSMSRPAALPAASAPHDIITAYAVQLAVLNRLGTSISGWKASMPDATHGTSAPIAGGNLLRSPARISDAVHRTARTERFGIEPEIAFTFRQALPPLADGALYTRAQVLSAVGGVHSAIEICVSRLADFEAAPALDRLADSIMNEALVLGTANTSWSGFDLTTRKLTVSLGGAIIHQGLGGHPIGDPVIPLLWLANHLSSRGIGLKAGDAVTTGSCAGIHYANAGQRVQVEFEGLGIATIEF